MISTAATGYRVYLQGMYVSLNFQPTHTSQNLLYLPIHLKYIVYESFELCILEYLIIYRYMIYK